MLWWPSDYYCSSSSSAFFYTWIDMRFFGIIFSQIDNPLFVVDFWISLYRLPGEVNCHVRIHRKIWSRRKENLSRNILFQSCREREANCESCWLPHVCVCYDHSARRSLRPGTKLARNDITLSWRPTWNHVGNWRCDNHLGRATILT